MEVRSKDGEIPMPSASISSASGERIKHHQAAIPSTLEHHHPLYHNPQVSLYHQILKPIRDPNLIPDPTRAPASNPPERATNTAHPPTCRSMSRSPPPQPTNLTIPSVRYRECLKNHAASMGGIVVDGCGEFMPRGVEGTSEAMTCAACECHRNFHRKEVDGEPQYPASCYYKNNTHRSTTIPSHYQLATSLPPPQTQVTPSLPSPQTQVTPSLPSPHVHGRHKNLHGFSLTAPPAPMMLTFGGGGYAAESSSEDLNMFQPDLQGQKSIQSLKKRFRTKFSQEQKDKMMEFAERLGWKIQKQDENEVQKFCSRVGVKRKVFKVWMHNNKQAMKKQM